MIDGEEEIRTLGEEAYRRLRTDILGGRLEPGAKLPLRNLSRHYGIGIAPLREALSRLASERLVALEGQRGFVVAPISRAELQDLFSLRSELSCKALRLAIEKGDDDWEDEILLAARRLERCQRPRSATDDGVLDAWEQRHSRFHGALIAACGSPWLIHFCDVLSDQFQRYRRLIMRHVAASEDLWSDIRQQHNEIAEATIARDAARAEQLLHDHLRGSVDTVMSLYPKALEERRRA